MDDQEIARYESIIEKESVPFRVGALVHHISLVSDEHGEGKTSGGFGAALHGLGKSIFSGGFWKKQEFDTKAYDERSQQRTRDLRNIEEKYLSKETKKKLEQTRRQRAATTTN